MVTNGKRARVGTALGTRGVTLIELLTVMVILSILAGIAMPKLRGAIIKAQAADVIGDLNAIKVAVLTYQSDNNAWPRDRGRGRVPPELVDYLPDGFTFQKDEYTLDYDNWSRRRRGPFNIGITFISRNQELGLTVLNMLGTNVWTNGRRKFTWIIDG
ncbi:MAG: prepilin-type N-terminal cleavage/methylation domain-containing protein [Gemmatimonadetes bacterium]|nr:prepilin-type N-terminal cleavage/methylation domain-containing protein [Gemmatimonadota bacterium]